MPENIYRRWLSSRVWICSCAGTVWGMTALEFRELDMNNRPGWVQEYPQPTFSQTEEEIMSLIESI